MKECVGKSIKELQLLLRSKEVSARDILKSHYAHINEHDKNINAFNLLTQELAEKQADRIDEHVRSGKPLPPLAGIPIAIKDNICVEGYPTTCSSKILEGFVSPYQSTCASKLFEAGAICIGKTNMDEFAMGSSTENSAFKKTANPWDTTRVPGGSSGGSSASVSAGFSVIAVGSDTGGSIRQPASFCGVVGMKPTYGMVSRFGLVAYASSLDQIGPFGRRVEDVAMTLNAISGHDPRDSTSIKSVDELLNGSSMPRLNQEFVTSLSETSPEKHIKGLRVALIKELLGEGIEKDVQERVRAAAEVFARLGATVEEVSIANAKFALPVYYLIATAEASANLARYDGVRYGLRDKTATDILSMYNSSRQQGFGAEVKRRIMLGTYALSTGYYDAYYKKAQQVRRLLTEDFDRIFKTCDILLAPTAPSQAFKFGDKTDDPLQMYLSDIATIPANLAGLPGISIPCGTGSSGMPIGLQLMGAQLSDALVLKAAYAFEQETEFHKGSPPMFNGAATARL